MRPIEYLAHIFFDLMRIQPEGKFYSTSISLAFSIVKLDQKDRKDVSKHKGYFDKLKYIEENTHENLKMPLAKVEAIVDSIERSKWNKEYEGKNNNDTHVKKRDGKEIRILDMYQYLKEAYTPIVEIVVDIIGPYSMEYRMTVDSGGIAPSFLGKQNE